MTDAQMIKQVAAGRELSTESRPVSHNLPTPRKTKVKYALLAAVPAAVMLGAVFKGKKKAEKSGESKHEPERDESCPREE
jgi:hypothetical protein